MRLWSLHPADLDAKGLVACWREALLARAVLMGLTKGYVHHPQLDRFRRQPQPVQAVDTFLRGIYEESLARGYRFSPDKFGAGQPYGTVTVTEGQLALEWTHLAAKLAIRDPVRRQTMAGRVPQPHPLFRVVPGPAEPWERV